MRRATQVAAGVGVLVGLLYLFDASRYSWGTPARPGPGIFPVMVGVLMVLGFAWTGLEATFEQGQAVVAWPAGAARWRVFAIAVASVGYVVLLPYIGHPAAAALITVAVLQIMGVVSWPLKIGLALGVALFSYYLFAVVLAVPLPMGVLFD